MISADTLIRLYIIFFLKFEFQKAFFIVSNIFAIELPVKAKTATATITTNRMINANSVKL